MKTLEDLLKDTNPEIIDAQKVFDKNGEVDRDYVKILSEEKPLIPNTRTDGRLKYFSIKENRDRYTSMPARLPTKNFMPFPVDAHEHIGQYESKHNLYLTTANVYNNIQDKLDDYILILQEVATRLINLEKRVTNLEKERTESHISNTADNLTITDSVSVE